MATFITSKAVGQFVDITITSSTGYWKYNHNGNDSSVFSNGSQTAEVLNENGEFTIIPCTSGGAVSGFLERIDIIYAQLTSFNGVGLSGLTSLFLNGNQLTSFNGTGLSSLVTLDLSENPLTTFIGGDMSLITTLDFSSDQWEITTLETFDGTGLTGLSDLNLSGNQIISLDVTPMTSLSQLRLNNNPITPQNWDSILSGLVGLGNEDGFLRFGTTQRTNASTSDYNTLISRYWVIDGTFEIYTPPTFITSKLTGETINIYVETTTGYWKYNHNGTDSSVFSNGSQSAEVLSVNGEFTIISCDPEGTVSGDITRLDLQSNGLTSFDGTGLSGLIELDLTNNQLTSFNGTGLSGLTNLALQGNLLMILDVSSMTSLTNLILNEKEGTNPLTATTNDSILNQLEANGLEDGFFITIGGRTAAGTTDYDTLISRRWTITGADLVTVSRKLRVKGLTQRN